MALTDIQVRNAAPRERDFKMSDSGGLYILVRSNGSKLWRMKYRVEGREQKLSFGPYPAISLKDARFRRDEARVEIGRGGNPARRERNERIEAEIAAGDTFAEVASEYIEKCAKEGYAEATLRKARWFLDLLKPTLGNQPIRDVSPHELLSALRRIERKGNRESARRADVSGHGLLGAVAQVAETYGLEITLRLSADHAISPEIFERPVECLQNSMASYGIPLGDWDVPAVALATLRETAGPFLGFAEDDAEGDSPTDRVGLQVGRYRRGEWKVGGLWLG